jgi:hypothetical protein
MLQHADGPWLLFGAAPDGVTSAELSQHDGSKTRLDVANNLFHARIPAGAPPRIDLLWADGHRTSLDKGARRALLLNSPLTRSSREPVSGRLTGRQLWLRARLRLRSRLHRPLGWQRTLVRPHLDRPRRGGDDRMGVDRCVRLWDLLADHPKTNASGPRGDNGHSQRSARCRFPPPPNRGRGIGRSGQVEWPSRSHGGDHLAAIGKLDAEAWAVGRRQPREKRPQDEDRARFRTASTTEQPSIRKAFEMSPTDNGYRLIDGPGG